MQPNITEISTLAQLWDQTYRNIVNTDTAITFSEQSEGLSYKKINAIAHCLAAYLIQHGIKKGDRIGLLCENSPMYLVMDLAIQLLGGVNVTFSTQFSHKLIKQAIRDFNIKALYLSSYDLYCKHKSWLEPLAPQLRIICNVPPVLELSETDKLVALYCATDVGKVYWREHLPQMRRLKNECEPNQKSAIFITPQGTDNYQSRQFTQQEILQALHKMAVEFRPVTQKNKQNILSIESFHLYFGRLAGLYLPLFYQQKIILNRTNRTLSQDILRSNAYIIVALNDTLERLFDSIRKRFLEDNSFRGRYFDNAFKNARKVQELKSKNQSVPFGLATKYRLARRTTLVRARRQYFSSVSYIFTANTPKFIDIFQLYLSLQTDVLQTKDSYASALLPQVTFEDSNHLNSIPNLTDDV